MIRSISLALCLLLFGILSAGNAQESPPYKRIACVGDSITHGGYPQQLAVLFKNAVEVGNFGVGGATLLNSGDKPYQKQKAFKDALSYNADCVIIMLGTNDSKPQNWKNKDQFAADYLDLIQKFKSLPNHPRIFICYPPLVANQGKYGINEAGVREEMADIDSIAKSENLPLIDMHSPFLGKESLFGDNVHPNAKGQELLARTAYKALTGKEPQ